jgi:hypothetical protein
MNADTSQLYIKIFPDQLSRSPAVEGFVQSVWELIGSNKLPGVADDAVCLFSVVFRVGYLIGFAVPARLSISPFHLHCNQVGLL